MATVPCKRRTVATQSKCVSIERTPTCARVAHRPFRYLRCAASNRTKERTASTQCADSRVCTSLDTGLQKYLPGAVHSYCTFAAAVACMAQLLSAPVALAEELTIALPVSRNPELRSVQQTLVETWAYINNYYVDPKLNSLDWSQLLQDALIQTFKASSKEEAYKAVNEMVKRLDDPFTKVLDPQASTKYSAQKEGQVLTNGLVAVRLPDKRVRVSYVLDGSPAQQAGLVVGDELVSVDGVAVTSDDFSLDTLPSKEATIRVIKRPTAAAAIKVALDATTPADAAAVRTLTLKPVYVSVNPVQYSLLQDSDGPPVGYVHLTSFTTTATKQVLDAVTDLKVQGARSVVLDLRDNPGGLVQAGLQVAEIFLKDGDVFCRVTDRQGEEQIAVIQQGQHLVDGSLVLLVNHNTTSTSELLAGALHDDYPALLVGENTFGKGRTQLAVELSDGSTLLVSTLLYTTPAGTVVDHVGLKPDVICSPEEMEMQYWEGGQVDDGSLLEDPCIALAYDRVKSAVRNGN